MRDIGRVGTGNSPPALCHFNSFQEQGVALPTGDVMTRFGMTGLRRTLFATVFFSLSAPAALAHDAASVKVAVNAGSGATINGYTPRKRIAQHPRNQARATRFIDSSKGRYVAQARPIDRTFNATRRALPSGEAGFEQSFEQLLLRYLRASIDSVKFDTAVRRARADFLGGAGQVTAPQEPITVEQAPAVPIQPTDGLLTEVANEGSLRPKAGIIRVSEHQKQLGRQRAALRNRQLDPESAARNFRFYRPNEAYDVRFPSVVYLNSN